MAGDRVHRPITLVPTTPMGWAAIIAMGLSLGGLMLVLGMMAIDSRPAWLIVAHPLTSAGAGVTSLILAGVAIVRRHDRALALLPPLAWGALVALVIVAELAFPH